jgi:hypothetical protein
MYYDSFGFDDKIITSSITKFLQQWQEHMGTTISNWKMKRAYSPPQTNTFDCGPWILQIAKCLSLQEPLMFNQNMMQSIRATQKSEVQNKELYPVYYKKLFNKHNKSKRKFRKQMYKVNKKHQKEENNLIRSQQSQVSQTSPNPSTTR